MPLRRNALIIASVFVLCLGWRSTRASAPEIRCDQRIAHVAHDGISFSVSIDSENNRFLEIVAPEKTKVQPRPIRISVRFRDESKIEGTPERQGSVWSGGYVDWRYRFDAKRSVAISDIFSVTIQVGDQMFDLYPW